MFHILCYILKHLKHLCSCKVLCHSYTYLMLLLSHHWPPIPTQTAAPKQWIAHDGEVTQMDTPDTIRAQQLREIYQSISRKELNPTERLDVLLTLKQTVKVSRRNSVSVMDSLKLLILLQAILVG